MLTNDELKNQTLNDWIDNMDQFVRVCLTDGAGNTVYINMNYYGDGYEYDDIDNGVVKKSPGPL